MNALLRSTIATLRQILSNRETLGVLVLATVIYGFFYPSPYLRQVLRDVPVVVVDRDHTPLSRQFARWLDASEAVAVSGRTEDLEAARDAVRAANAGAIVLIPEDFERHILRREPAYVTTYADASYLLVYSTVSRSVNAVATTMGAAVARTRPPVTLASWPLFNPIGGYATFLVPAVFILVLQQTLLIGVGALRVAERHAGGLEREPVWAVLGGKMTALVLLYLLHAAFLFLVAFWIYDLPFQGALVPTAAFLVPFIISTTLLALVIGELFRRPESPLVVYALTAIPAIMLSGISFPVEVQAGWVRALAMTLPSTFGIQGFIQIGEMGATLGEARHAWIALWIQALVYGTIAAALMHWRRSGNPLHQHGGHEGLTERTENRL